MLPEKLRRLALFAEQQERLESGSEDDAASEYWSQLAVVADELSRSGGGS
jgi:hypothetical protein